MATQKINDPKEVLYISYDGMTDPLGQSQVLPYVFGIAAAGYKVTMLSCEKKDRYEKNKGLIRQLCEANHVNWQPEFFHTSPPILAKYYDLFTMRKRAFQLYARKKFSVVHCRSYIAIEIGLALKRAFGCKVIFDMRGFWVDERVDGGLWNVGNPLYKYAYRSYKKKENKFIHGADHIISLTEAGKQEMTRWKGHNSSVPVTVIPCSADFDVFSLTNSEQKRASRNALGYAEDDFVMSYLGSLGTWYLLDEMLDFFKEAVNVYPKARFLFITADNPDMVFSKAEQKGIDKAAIQVKFAPRNEVANMVKASDVSVFFIKQAYSKIASSPTKLGELLAMGIPVVCNGRIGDVESIMKTTGGGIVIDQCNSASYKAAIEDMARLLAKEPAEIRRKALEYYSLDDAIRQYVHVYSTLQ